MSKYSLLFLFILLALFSACEKESDGLNNSLLPGFWAQEAILVDGDPVVLSECEQSTRLLIEANGVYRLYSSCDDQERAGTWYITNDTILDLTMDRLRNHNYEPYPVRFTILSLTEGELEIRIKTFVGERKKMVLFTPLPQDDLTGMSPEEILELDRYNKTLKTYIYRFSKN